MFSSLSGQGILHAQKTIAQQFFFIALNWRRCYLRTMKDHWTDYLDEADQAKVREAQAIRDEARAEVQAAYRRVVAPLESKAGARRFRAKQKALNDG